MGDLKRHETLILSSGSYDGLPPVQPVCVLGGRRSPDDVDVYSCQYQNKKFSSALRAISKKGREKKIMNISRGAKLFDSTRLRFVKTCLLAGLRPASKHAVFTKGRLRDKTRRATRVNLVKLDRATS